MISVINVFIKYLNGIDYGIPQNRERWFMVCIREYKEIFNFQNLFLFKRK